MGRLSTFESIFLYFACFGASAFACNLRIRKKWLKLLLVITPPTLLATFRLYVGYDYNSYIWGYYIFEELDYASILADFSPGSPILFDLITKFSTEFHSERVYLFILAVLSLLPMVSYVLECWKDTGFAPMILYCLLFSQFLFSFSAIKQGIALSFLIYSLKYVYARKPLRFFLCVAIACLFHSSAIVFFSVYFMLNSYGELTFLKKLFVLIGLVIVIVNLGPFLTNLWDGRYERYVTETVEGRNRSFYLYALIALIFLVYRRKLIELDGRNDLLIFLMVIGAICQYLGFSNAFTKRIGEYFIFSQSFLLPQMSLAFTDRSRKAYNGLLCLYLLAMLVIAYPTAESGMGYIPYYYKFR